MKHTTKRVLLTAGAIVSFVTMFALFGLIFYQLFRPNTPFRLDIEDTVPSSASSVSPHPLSIPSIHPPPLPSPVPYTILSSSSPSSARKRLRKLWEAKSDRDRATLLVQSVNLNPNTTWNAKLNKHAIGLKPLSEMLNFSNNFDPMNSTFMMDPFRLKAIEQHIVERFHPLYDRHLYELEFRTGGTDRPLPDRFNAAQRWPSCSQSILKVRDQGGCGSCWAVAAVSVMSDRICIASGGRVMDSLSAQQLVECCDYCGGCTGAPNSFFPFLYWHQEGLQSDQCFPYTIARDCGYPCPPTEFEHPRGLGNCTKRRDQCADQRKSPTRHRARYVYKIGSLDEDEHFFPVSLFHRLKSQQTRFATAKTARAVDLLKRELMVHGPVMLCFSVYEGFMHYYDGIYNFELVPGEVHVYDHCIKVIGWGKQRRPNSGTVQEYLLAINSWHSLWAKDGTFKMDLSQLGRFHSDLFAGVPF